MSLSGSKYKCPRSETGSDLNPGGLPPLKPPRLGWLPLPNSQHSRGGWGAAALQPGRSGGREPPKIQLRSRLRPGALVAWLHRDLCNSLSVLGSFGAVFPGHREGARVVPHPAPCELSSRHKPGSFGAVFAAVLGAVLGPARPAGTGPGGPKRDIDCYRGPDTANIYIYIRYIRGN